MDRGETIGLPATGQNGDQADPIAEQKYFTTFAYEAEGTIRHG